MSIDVRQVVAKVIRPALRTLGPGFATEAAEHLLLGTAAVESDFRALAQYGGGPAVGLWQMEPATYRDLWKSFLEHRPSLRLAVLSFGSRAAGDPPPAEEMTWNFRLAAAMCRVHYFRFPDPLPAARDVKGMAALWKLRYNTPLGAGREDDFLRAWVRHVAPIL